MPHSSRARAFTLVEVAAVVVVLALLAGIGIVAYGQVTARADDQSTILTVDSVVREAQGLTAARNDAAFTDDDYVTAGADLPPAPGDSAAGGWPVSTAAWGYVTHYGRLHVRLAADGSTAGIAAVSPAGHCVLGKATVTGTPLTWIAGAVGAACSGDTALGDPAGSTVSYSDPATYGPPAAPSGLTATPAVDGFTATWTANTEPDLAGYRLVVDGVTEPANVLGTTATRTATPGPHTVAVVAVDRGGLVSQPSDPVTVTVPPDAPATVTATVTGGTATVSWSAAPAATTYRVWRLVGTDPAVLVTQVAAPATTTADPTTPPGATVTYLVSAANAGGESPATPADAAVTVPPGAPSGVTASATGTDVTVAWQSDYGALTYAVYADGATTPAWIGTATSWTDSGLPAGSTHRFVVTASNPAGESAPSAAATATTIPLIPGGLTATGGDNTVTLAWNSSAGAAAFRVYRSPDGSTFTPIGQTTATTFADPSAVNGTSYWYAVSAYNPAGESGLSTAATTRPLPPMPATPTGVSTSVSGTTVTVRWNAVSRADSYRLYRGGQLVTQTTATSFSIDVGAGVSTSFTVSATNLAGESAQSAPATAVTAPAQPGTPSLSAGDGLYGQVTVSFGASPTAGVTYHLVQYNTCTNGYAEVWSGAATSVRLGGHYVRCGYSYIAYTSKNGASSGWTSGSAGWWPSYAGALGINNGGSYVPGVAQSPVWNSSAVQVYWDSTYGDGNPQAFDSRRMTQYGGGSTYEQSDGSQSSPRFDTVRINPAYQYCFLLRTYYDGNAGYMDTTVCD